MKHLPLSRPRALLVAVGLLITSPIHASQQPRVHPDAREIRAFRLTEEHLRKLAQVTQAMERVPSISPEAPRSDLALFVVLSMPLAYNEPFSDSTVSDMVPIIESGHPELAASLRAAGLSSREYVLTQIMLLLTYPVVAAERAGRPTNASADIPVENLAFVRARWSAVDDVMQAIGRGLQALQR